MLASSASSRETVTKRAAREDCDDLLAVVAVTAISLVKVCGVGLGARGASLCCHCSVSALGVGLGYDGVGLEGGLSTEGGSSGNSTDCFRSEGAYKCIESPTT